MTSPTGGPGRDPVEQRLRRTMEHMAARHEPAPVPMQRILRASRVRRTRRRTLTAAAAACLLAGLAVPVARLTSDGARRVDMPPAVTATPSPHPSAHLSAPAAVSAPIGSGTVAGVPWSVTLVYYPRLPAGYVRPDGLGTTVYRSLLCKRTVVAGIRVDRQGGQWADCYLLTGPDDPDDGSALFTASTPGQHDTRVFIGHPVAGTTHAVVTLHDGHRSAARVVDVPGTAQRAYAVALAAGSSIAYTQEYDASGHLLKTVPGGLPDGGS
jgi:hypothetical protein